jgi:hypothetical protein
VKGQQKTAHMLAMCIWSHPHSTFTLTFIEEYSMVLPDSSLYKDFNSETDFVDHKMDNIEVYLKPMEMNI